jgi:phage terminase large subunit-like protein
VSAKPEWTTALPDWERRIVARESLLPCPPLFASEAEAALAVFKALKVVDLPGMPTFGEVCEQWVFDFVGAIFGAYDAEAGRRLINEFFLLISKKNGKSTIAAGIMVTALIRNWRYANELIILAPTIEIAKNSADPAMGMVQNDEELLTFLKPIPHERTIEHRVTKAKLKIVAADSETVGGKKAGFVLIDELWLFGKSAKAEDMLREAVGGLASRREGFVVALSTMSNEPPAGVFKQWLKRFRDIRDGKIVSKRSLGILYEFPKAMIESKAYERPENFYVTNPSLGGSVDEAFLMDTFAAESEKGVVSLTGFFAKHLNVEITQGLRSDGWAGANLWSRGADKSLTLKSLLERSEVATVGIDGGGLDDLLGLAVIGREKETKRWLGWATAFISPEGLERRKANRSIYDGFKADGDLIYVDELPEDVAKLVEIVERVKDSGLLSQVGVDPAGLGVIVDALADIGVTEDDKNLIGVRQGFGLMGAIKTIERKLADGSFKHADQALMAWCAGNAIVQPTPTGMRIVRDASGFGKIDPLMAMNDAAALMAMNPVAMTSVYDQIDGEQSQDDDDQSQSVPIDQAILGNPQHPQWQQMRERYEASLGEEDGEEF